MKLDNYTDFDDKAIVVKGTKRVVEAKDIDEIFKQFDNFTKKQGDERLIFRGIEEAAYKLFSSSQREWIVNKPDKTYSDYLLTLLNKAKTWNGELLQQYLKSFNNNLENNNIAYFSIMQHYGLPTPLLDFTYNPFVALYFACNNVDKCFYDDDFNNIRNYFSIYFIWSGWFTYKEFTKNIEDIKLDDFSDNIYQIENDRLVNNNLNILAQKGLFLINTSPQLDLIGVLKKLDNDSKQTFFGCYNIHKSLAKTIKEKLLQREITENRLFPDLKELKI